MTETPAGVHGDPSADAIVQTFEFEGAPGHVMLDTTTLEERGGATLVRTVSAFTSTEDRDFCRRVVRWATAFGRAQ